MIERLKHGTVWIQIGMAVVAFGFGWALNATRNTERIRALEDYRTTHETTMSEPIRQRVRSIEIHTATLSVNQSNISSSINGIQGDIREIRNILRTIEIGRR